MCEHVRATQEIDEPHLSAIPQAPAFDSLSIAIDQPLPRLIFLCQHDEAVRLEFLEKRRALLP